MILTRASDSVIIIMMHKGFSRSQVRAYISRNSSRINNLWILSITARARPPARVFGLCKFYSAWIYISVVNADRGVAKEEKGGNEGKVNL